MTDPYIGKLSFIRVYSGTLKSGTYIYNSNKEIKERVNRLVMIHADHREDVKEIYAGDLGAIIGLKKSTTGDTICDDKKPIILELMKFPEPVISIAIEPKNKAEQDKMALAWINYQKKIQLLEERIMLKPVKLSSRVWESCI